MPAPGKPVTKSNSMRFNDPKFAREYEARMTAEAYPGKLLDAAARELTGLERLIDIGAGTGLFALPLAMLGHRVTAVEPSGEMARIMREKTGEDIAPRLSVHAVSWEQWLGWRHDGALCAHSIYGMKDIPAALGKMKLFSGKTVLLVRYDAESRTLSEIIKKRVGQGASLYIEKSAKDFALSVTSALGSLGVPHTAKLLVQRRTTRFADAASEARYYARRIGSDEGAAGNIEEILKEYSEKDEEGYSFENIYADFLITF